VRGVDELRSRPARRGPWQRNRGPNLHGVPERHLQRDGEHGELHALDRLRSWHLRERARNADGRSSVHAVRGGNVLVDGEPIAVLAAAGLRSGDGADGTGHGHLTADLHPVSCGNVLRRRHGSEGPVRRRDVGSRRQPGDGVHAVDELRLGSVRGNGRQRYDGSDVCSMHERDVQLDVERHELHALDDVRTRHVRERVGHDDRGSPVRTLRGWSVQLDLERHELHAVDGLPPGHLRHGTRDRHRGPAVRGLSGRADEHDDECGAVLPDRSEEGRRGYVPYVCPPRGWDRALLGNERLRAARRWLDDAPKIARSRDRTHQRHRPCGGRRTCLRAAGGRDRALLGKQWFRAARRWLDDEPIVACRRQRARRRHRPCRRRRTHLCSPSRQNRALLGAE